MLIYLKTLREKIVFITIWILLAIFIIYKSTGDTRFVPVSEGIIYRSAQLDEKELDKIINNFNIKTIINLRGIEECAKDLRCKKELKVSKAKIIQIPISAVPDLNQLRKILKIICNPDYQPILVHCELGKTRTGAVIAAYRVACEKYPVEIALYEAQYFHYSKKNLDKLKKRLSQLETLVTNLFSKPVQGSVPFFRTKNRNRSYKILTKKCFC